MEQRRSFQDLFKRVKIVCDDVCRVAAEEQFGLQQIEAQKLKQKVDGRVFKVAVVALAKAGKSTLLNALLRRELLPRNVLPGSYSWRISIHITRSCRDCSSSYDSSQRRYHSEPISKSHIKCSRSLHRRSKYFGSPDSREYQCKATRKSTCHGRNPVASPNWLFGGGGLMESHFLRNT